jgi:hypothetical protein
MKTLFNIRTGLLVFLAIVLFSCASGQYSNYGTAHDRTGTNGATNGNGKTPRGTSHRVNY